MKIIKNQISKIFSTWSSNYFIHVSLYRTTYIWILYSFEYFHQFHTSNSFINCITIKSFIIIFLATSNIQLSKFSTLELLVNEFSFNDIDKGNWNLGSINYFTKQFGQQIGAGDSLITNTIYKAPKRFTLVSHTESAKFFRRDTTAR